MDYRDYRSKYNNETVQRHKKPRNGNGKLILAAIVLLAIILAAVVVIVVVSSTSRPDFVARTLTIEAGRSAIKASDFLMEKGHTAEFADDVYYDLSKVGEYKIGLIVDGESCSTKLVIVDTVAPTAFVADFSVRKGSDLLAEDCVSAIIDATEVSVKFKKKPDTNKIGKHNVTVILEDGGGNKTEYSFVLDVVSESGLLYTHYVSELGEPMPSADVFTGTSGVGEYVTAVSNINTSTAGMYMIQISMDGTVYDVVLEIADRTAPTATVTPQNSYNSIPAPETFISNIVDKSQVSVSYESEPRASESGRVDVVLILTDAYGNSTRYESYFTVLHDNVAPEITKYPESLEVDTGATLLWRASVEATDDSGEVELSLDTSAANLNVPGIYTIEIVARDAAGNETRRPVKLTVNDGSITDEMLRDVIAGLKKNIGVKDTMTNEEKVYAVFRFVYDSMKYSNTSSHVDWRSEAYHALSGAFTGDCFTYCAASYAILGYLGFDVYIVERAESAKIEGTGTHFWVLVNIGTESNPQWYHFDATPQRAPYNLPTYLMTDAQLEAYTRWRNADYKLENYYTYDKEKFPAVATWQRVSLEIPAQYFAQ